MSDKVFSLRFSDIKWLFIFSYFVSVVIDSMMILSFNINFVPYLTLLILLFWSTQILNQTHLFSAFALGLLFDASMNTPLGSHSLIFVTITFLMLRSRLRFKGYPLWQQSIIVGSYFILFQIMSWFIFHPVLVGNAVLYYWVEPLLAILIWPVLTQIMHQLTHRSVFS
ncbi:rod shape-determining protein MreD [Hydrogenovibrio crunogenus]|uniref:Rod shape-determining protein MreD n=1 Tax=Hydrogenovibrio crunogenus TaxID=39765 RepID=A0A4V1C8Z9_9GAMM|nr:rod shape-determining protein MreD [Hydrogenovibrio crunogenus]QBZ83664.1 rod shape-determining protein MreD [Hydrogenovibrio crunogenus]